MPEGMQKKKDYLTILTVSEVAEYLRMSEAKVYRLAKEKRLPVVRIGKSWRFRKDLLDDWLRQCTEPVPDDNGARNTSRVKSANDHHPEDHNGGVSKEDS
jgi:excisionase family DNA binding protein